MRRRLEEKYTKSITKYTMNYTQETNRKITGVEAKSKEKECDKG